ncbi:MAG TPA: amino acid ABC transporter substrate-binding protein [Accumulibacter sp.]|uniref:amino acid ABC transporter substrate-binding protein n=1 Tax=Accumulibacter sp. TaxID=2053492 RepID=UPI0025FCBDD3|nr:amino acid ABC transporter substrate-binding protein [Accumulibacter sp.]MCM8599982.1 amino acid ABC transporter substrate-binding protein [Accumulibacter sp.]MCM8664169.1 amino acid ABC transporter substrate-binding protein [Accumulibacter sp.]HNC53374.1 amino acid ABC transporter substrate-binding protein [Accumulibacter sp.]
MFRSAAFVIALLLAPAFASAQVGDGRLKKIKESKTVAIAYRSDALPFSFIDDATKQPTGYSIDLCRRVVSVLAQRIGVEGVQIKWVPVTLQSRMEAIQKGQADMECGSTTVTLSRMQQVNFSSFIFVDGTGLLIKSDSNVRQLADLGGKKIGVMPGTTNEAALNAALKRSVINAIVVPVKTREEGLAEFEAGRIDAFASDRVLLLGLGSKAKDPKKISLLLEDLSFEPYAITLPRGDDDFRLAVNAALSQIYRSGAIGEIFQNWFGALGKPGPVLEACFLFGSIPD